MKLTKEQTRGRILRDRLKLLGQYLTEENTTLAGKPFSYFLKEHGVSREEFVKDLPKSLQNPPASGHDKIIVYMNEMNNVYINEYEKDVANAENSADGEAVVVSDIWTKSGFTPTAPSIDYLNQKKSETGFVNLSADAAAMGGDMGYLTAHDNYYNVFFGPALYTPGESPATLAVPKSGYYPSLQEGLDKMKDFVVEYGRQLDYHTSNNHPQDAEYVGRELDDIAFIVSLYEQRIANQITANDAMNQLLNRNNHEKIDIDNLNRARASELSKTKSKPFLEKLRARLKGDWSKIKSEVRSDLGDLKKTAQDIGRGIKSVTQKVVSTVDGGKAAHVAAEFFPPTVLARAAFLSILKENVVGMATAMSLIKNAGGKEWDQIEQRWWQLGGNKDKFSSIVNQGKNKRALFANLIKGSHAADGSLFANASVGKIVAGATAALGAIAAILAAIPEPTATTKAAAGWVAGADAVAGTMTGYMNQFANNNGAQASDYAAQPVSPLPPSGGPDGKVPVDTKPIDDTKLTIGDQWNNLNPAIKWTIGSALVIGVVVGIIAIVKSN